jgi:hypothetical protein
MSIDGQFGAFLAEDARWIKTFMQPPMDADKRRFFCEAYRRSSAFIGGSNAVGHTFADLQRGQNPCPTYKNWIKTFIKPQINADERRYCWSQYRRLSAFIGGCNAVDVARP